MEPRAGLYLLALALLASPARAGLLLTQKEALAIAFPEGTKVERRTAYLTQQQAREAQEAAHAKVESRVWSYYVGSSSRGAAGYAYFETHTVRTMPETFMAILEPDGSLRSVELLSFLEPDDYRPRKNWLDQFRGRSLDGELWLRRGVRNITGASLTSQALTEAIRRVLAVHAVIRRAESEREAVAKHR